MKKIKRIALVEAASSGLHVFSHWAFPRLGLPILGTILAKLRYEVRIFIEDLAYGDKNYLDWEYLKSCDLIGFSALTSTVLRSYAIAKQAKAQNPQIVTVMGGPHATFFSAEALVFGIDYVVRGEGDFTFPQLIAALNEDGDLSGVDNLAYLDQGILRLNPMAELVDNLDEIPFPDFALIKDFRKMKIMPMVFSRGCPFNCKFCSVVPMFGRACRHLSVERAFEDFRQKKEFEAKHNLKERNIFIVDDNHTANPKWAKEFWRRALDEDLAPKGVVMQTRIDVTRDLELMEVLSRISRLIFCWGVESPTDEALLECDKKQTVAQIIEAHQITHRFKIKTHDMFVAGFDSHTKEIFKIIAEFALRVRTETLQVLALTPVPGTLLWQEMLSQNRIVDRNWNHYNGHFPVFEPKNMTRWQLLKGLLWSQGKFYSLKQFIKLTAKFQWFNAFLRGYGRSVVIEWKKRNRDYIKKLKQTRFQRKAD